jgi:dihydrofolate reductase
MISIIVAIAEDNGIGNKNDLLWHIPEDLKRFRKLTLGNTVIMGKKTWESLPNKPLPGRKNIIITDDLKDNFEPGITTYSIEEALSKCGADEEIFIIGGGSIYRQFMPLADRLYITHIHKKAPADVFFPKIDPAIWEVAEKDEHEQKEGSPLTYTYIIYNRKRCND